MLKIGYLEIGDNNFWNDDCSINVREFVKIGNKNLFGKNVNLYDHNHIFDDLTKNKATEFYTHKVEIGNENWFGTNVTILSKSKIGDHNVVGAGTVLNIEILSDYIVKENRECITKQIQYKK